MLQRLYLGVRLASDRIGFDLWDIDICHARQFMARHEAAPVSRFWFGSPCRFIRTIDVLVHVLLPSALAERYPELACYLRSTSPRWGKAWRSW